MERGLEKQKEKFAAVAVFLFVVIYPLFLLHGYVDVLEAKLLLMKGILIFTFCGIFLLLMTDFCLQKNKKRYLWEKGKIFFKSLSFTDKAILGLSGSFCISFALSQDKNISWTGLEARGNGMLYYMLMFLLYFVISRYYIPGKRERNWWFVSTNILILYALIQFLGFDFLHLFPQNTEGIVTDYLSFLGNTGVFALYITLVLPVALYFSCMIYKKQDTTSEKILFYITFLLSRGKTAEAAHFAHEFYFESAAMILTLITVGKMLEARSKGKTTDALKALMKLTPKTANGATGVESLYQLEIFNVTQEGFELQVYRNDELLWEDDEEFVHPDHDDKAYFDIFYWTSNATLIVKITENGFVASGTVEGVPFEKVQ